jgi:thermitase
MKALASFIAILFIFQNIIPALPSNAQSPSFPTKPITQTTKEKKNYRDGEVIITYKEKTAKEFQAIIKKEKSDEELAQAIEEKKEKLIQSLRNTTNVDDLQITEHISDLGISLVTSEKESTENLIEKLRKDDNVEYAEPNYLKKPVHMPNDSNFAYQWAHYIDSDHDIDTTNAWDNESSSASDTTVAVIDSGVDYAFPDLAGNMWDGSIACISDSGDSVSCPNHGWDYDDNDNDPDDSTNSSAEFQWHGTHTASVIGATTDNNLGIAGISRYNHVKIMALRFGLDTMSEIKAINFAKNNGAKVINASFAGEDFIQAEKNAIDSFPGLVIAAAGNGSSDSVGDNNDSSPQYPCNYSSNNVICVGASDDTDNLTSFSNYGIGSVDIVAPGKGILGIQQDTYYYGSGTSLSTPFVAGTAALLWAHRPEATIETVRSTLLQSSDHLETLSGKIVCSRRLNVNTALQSIINETIPAETCSVSPVYRFWSDAKQGHFFTSSVTEKESILINDFSWKYEGMGFNAHTTQIAGTYPVYRFWSDTKQHHFYTISLIERNSVTTNDSSWTYEGVAYYAYIDWQLETTAVYRFWSDIKQGHFYTASLAEKNSIIANDSSWKYEGVAWYVPVN